MKSFLKKRLSQRQYEILRALAFEWKRFKCRMSSPPTVNPSSSKLHLGSGARPLAGWLNVDMVGSDLNLDIANGFLPFPDACFDAILSQHVVEHLYLEDEFLPLIGECQRILKPGGVMWISTPDLGKLAHSYVKERNKDLIADRQKRLSDWNMGDVPSQHFMNDMFYQQGEHKCIFDFDMLDWALRKVGFNHIERGSEGQLMEEFLDVPARHDDYQSVYVRVVK